MPPDSKMEKIRKSNFSVKFYNDRCVVTLDNPIIYGKLYCEFCSGTGKTFQETNSYDGRGEATLCEYCNGTGAVDNKSPIKEMRLFKQIVKNSEGCCSFRSNVSDGSILMDITSPLPNYNVIDFLRDSIYYIHNLPTLNIHYELWEEDAHDKEILADKPLVDFDVIFNKKNQYEPYCYVDFDNYLHIATSLLDPIITKRIGIHYHDDKYSVFPYTDEKQGIVSLFAQEMPSPFISYTMFDCISFVISRIQKVEGYDYKFSEIGVDFAAGEQYNDFIDVALEDIPFEL
jgi:hypothetical protein